MKILVIRGYNSNAFIDEKINLAEKDVHITIVPIGKPVLLRRKLKDILSKYNLDDYDLVYVVSMSSCITSIIDEKYFDKLCMITPFFLRFRPVAQLFKSAPKDFFGCHILMLLNGFMGRVNQRIKVKLAENDSVTDNNYFQKKFKNAEMLFGLDHYLGEGGALEIIKQDLVKLLKSDVI